MKTYEYHHTVSFEETNLVGNVYYANHVRWQGRCREMFLKDFAPEILKELSQDLALATVRVSCEYFAELYAFDKVIIRMHLGGIVQNRISMVFEYWRVTGDREELVAKGEQVTASMRRQGNILVPTPIPISLKEALEQFS